jgi:hypothetical protein
MRKDYGRLAADGTVALMIVALLLAAIGCHVDHAV